MLKNIPKELRALPQWVIATKSSNPDHDKLPMRADNIRKMADPTLPESWNTFEMACEATTEAKPHVGFVLSVDDPYCIIDLDNPDNPKKDWPEEHRAMLRALNTKIMATFESYTEMSQSGTGVHIIVKGSIPKGVNRDTVEMYSDTRYMITTGRVIKDLPIVECQELLDLLYNEMKPMSASVELEELVATEEDNDIIEQAMLASNGQKFTDLCNSVPDGVQNSEQDLALLSIIAFYSESNEQCRRIFRMTGRGKREKVVKNDKYLDYTLQKIRANAVPKVDFSALQANMQTLINGDKQIVEQNQVESGGVDLTRLLARANRVAKGEPEVEIEEAEPDEPIVVTEKPVQIERIEFPAGLVGKVAEYIYAQAARQVHEIALMGSLGFLAGIVGRQYNVSAVGLNQYLVLLAKTGTGKEGIASGIGLLNSELRKHIPMVADFSGPSAFASGPAMVKTIAEKPCFLSILGEFGLTLQQLCDPKANGAQVTLRQAYLDLYQKSGKGSSVNPSVYSDKEKNTELVHSPALTVLGESTPETFYEGLSEHHISDGLIPRFTILEYRGNRPYLNANLGCSPPDELISDLVELLQVVLDMQMNKSNVDVLMTKQVKEVADQFEIQTTDMINASTNRVYCQLWSRADLKIKKMAGLVAVGVNIHKPVIDLKTYKWAKEFVEQDIRNMMDRFEKGDVGHGESKQYVDMVNKVQTYFKNKPTKEYKLFHAAGVIPIKYLRRSLSNISSFKKDSKGVGSAIKAMLQEAIEAGDLVEIAAPQALKQFNTTSKLYGIGKGL